MTALDAVLEALTFPAFLLLGATLPSLSRLLSSLVDRITDKVKGDV